MPVKEMIEYLQTFPEDAEAGFIVADVGERVIYQVKELIGLPQHRKPGALYRRRKKNSRGV